MSFARRGQGVLEYIILIAGALLIVVLAIAVFQQLQSRSAKQIEAGVAKHSQLVCAPIYDLSPQTTVLAWKMHEGSGATAFDSSPKRAHGTISNAAWETDQAKCRNIVCLSFNGAGSVQSGESVSLFPGGVTVEAWLTPAGGGLNNEVPIVFMDGPNLLLYIDRTGASFPQARMQGKIAFRVRTSGPAVEATADSLETYDERPYHFAATYDAQTKTAVVYVDGVEKKRVTGSYGTVDATPGIPVAAMWRGNYLRGRLSDAAVYGKALSQEEIWREINCYPV